VSWTLAFLARWFTVGLAVTLGGLILIEVTA